MEGMETSTGTRGRVLGSPPTKPGFGAAAAAAAQGGASGSFTSRAQELVQAGQQARRDAQERRDDSGFSLGLPIRDAGRDAGFSPGLVSKESGFSPGLPLRPASSAPQGGPAESPPTLDYDTPPPEAPPSESRIPTPLLLRRRPKEGG